MRVLTIILVAVAAGLAPTALADPYKELAAQGYRWVSVDGPYACRSKDDLRKVTKHRTDQSEVKMVQELGVYYLIQGQIVQTDQEDVAAGMSQIHVPGHATKVWTMTRFLSREPIRDASGIFETPTTLNMMPKEQLGFPTAAPAKTATPSPIPKSDVSPAKQPDTKPAD
ncbi:MAG: hypothetical protein JOZ08_10095 [Verrucomicrobia bacterium]|nr:hypothetical protein [Verrucomicrobiota bacterium]MBV8276808.1 hypothetical protein [Verrucomicrobiota bacterium]